MSQRRGMDGVGAMLVQPRWGLALGAAVAAVVASFLIGWSSRWTPTLMMASAAGVILSALLMPRGRFPRAGEYVTSLLIPGMAIGWVVQLFVEELGEVFGISVYGYDGEAAVIAATLSVATAVLLGYAFLVGVRGQPTADA
jgi:hypothetical protein